MQSARDKLFAGAGWAGDEHVGVVPSDFACQLENLDHSGTSPDDAVELKIVEKLLLEVADLGATREKIGEIIESL
jgi:hypothetical protein